MSKLIHIHLHKAKATKDTLQGGTGKGHWITINGAHVKVSQDGNITAGPKELKAAVAHHEGQAKVKAAQQRAKVIPSRPASKQEISAYHEARALTDKLASAIERKQDQGVSVTPKERKALADAVAAEKKFSNEVKQAR